MCFYSRIIENKKYKPNKMNGGVPPKCKDERVKAVTIGCGVCKECLAKRKREWQIRLHEEIKHTKDPRFVTLTFSEESLIKLSEECETDEAIAIATRAVHEFTNRWIRMYKKTIRHWLVTELGHKNTERLHLHGIIFTDKTEEEIRERWKYGDIYIGDYVNAKTINYIVKYVTKIDQDHKGFKPKIFPSPGLGAQYIGSYNSSKNIFDGENTNDKYRLPNGIKIPMPIYYRNKIYTEKQREQLWIQMLDKEVIYIGGEEIDISTPEGLEEAQKAREYYQKLNESIGYGTIDWKTETYIASRKLIDKPKDIRKNNKENLEITKQIPTFAKETITEGTEFDLTN